MIYWPCGMCLEMLPAHADTMGREYKKYSEKSDRIWEMLMDFANDIDWGDASQQEDKNK